MEPLGVPLGVAVGVELELSPLAFLDEERGVILWLRKALTGVEMSSLAPALGVRLDSAVPFRRRVGGVDEGVEPAILGVKGGRVALLAALRVGINGRGACCWLLLCLSNGILACHAMRAVGK